LIDGLREHQKHLLDNVSCVVIDEDISDEITNGSVALPLTTFDEEQLDRHPVLDQKTKLQNDAKTSELNLLFAKIQNALDLIDAGKPAREAVATAGLTKSEADQARALSWQRKIPHKMFPGMALNERKLRAAEARFNTKLRGIATALHAFAEICEAVEAGENKTGKDGERLWIEGGRLVVPGLRQVKKQFAERPIIWASATTRPERARQILPDIEVVAPPQPAASHQRIHLRIGAFGKSSFGRSAHKITDMIDRVRVEMLGRRKGLVIAHKDIEHAFTGIANVETLHHGSVAGDDDFAGIDALFVVGGPFAPPGDVRKLAQAEARARVAYCKPVRTPCAVLLDHPFVEHPIGVQFERLGYTDPRMQRVHEGVYDAGIIQAIGRARGLNRTAENSVDVFVFGNLPLPMPVTSVERTKPVSRLDKMILAGHVPTNARDLARAHPRMFPSADAAAKARDGWGKRDGMQARILQLAQLAGDAWDSVLWQPDAKGHKGRITFVPHAKRGEFKAEVIRTFGSVLIWQAQPLYRPAGWLEDMEEGRKSDIFLPSSESSFDGQPRLRVSRGVRAARPAPRAPPHQTTLF
jgi:hypothetical protein